VIHLDPGHESPITILYAGQKMREHSIHVPQPAQVLIQPTYVISQLGLLIFFSDTPTQGLAHTGKFCHPLGTTIHFYHVLGLAHIKSPE